MINFVISEVLIANQLDAISRDEILYTGADKGIKLVPETGQRWMRVELRISWGQPGEKAGDKGLIHVRVLQQTANQAGMTYAAAVESGAGAGGEANENKRVGHTVKPSPASESSVQPKCVPRQAHAPNAKARGVTQQD